MTVVTTVPELLEKRAAILAALGEGALRVVFHSGGTRREVEYRSVPDLRSALDAIDREISAISRRPVRRMVPFLDRDF